MKKILAVITVVLLAAPAFSQDRVFTHTYQTNVLPLGVMELESWTTVRSGREEFYNRLDQRLELELGLGKNWQTAFYFNTSTITSLGAFGLEKENEIGFSNEWKVKLSDPVANKIGAGLYAEIGFNGGELELEGKLLLDKRIGKNIFAANFVVEYEMEFEYEAEENEVEAETELPFEIDLAWMRMCTERCGLGLEVRNHNENGPEEGWESSALYAGPTAHFNGNRWWINFSVMPQLTNLHKEEGETESLDLEHHEKVQARVLVSFMF
jgi:hypothetical protein